MPTQIEFCSVSRDAYDKTMDKWHHAATSLLELKEEKDLGLDQSVEIENLEDYIAKVCGFCNEFICVTCSFSSCLATDWIDKEPEQAERDVLDWYEKSGNPYEAIQYYVHYQNFDEALKYVDILVGILQEFERRGFVEDQTQESIVDGLQPDHQEMV